jgi:hypothetical protein
MMKGLATPDNARIAGVGPLLRNGLCGKPVTE